MIRFSELNDSLFFYWKGFDTQYYVPEIEQFSIHLLPL